MNRLSIFALATLLACGLSYAHDSANPGAPNPSPNASISQVVGHTDVSMTFGRPGVKGRTIWGDVVAYNGGDPRPWVAGANGSTIIEFSDDVTINGKDLKAGKYGFFIIPSEESWTLIFSNNSSKYGIMQYKAEDDALRIEVTPESADFQEWLDYRIEKTGDYSATISLHWENVKAGFTVGTPDHKSE